LVPNFADFRTREADGSSRDFGHELDRHSYRCAVKGRKYYRSSIANRFGVFPADYYLFERSRMSARETPLRAQKHVGLQGN
jgi:hypothetical protein